MADARHRGDRPRGGQPLPVRRRPGHVHPRWQRRRGRPHRHRRAGHDPCRGEEPRARRHRRRPGRLRPRARRAAGRRRARRRSCAVELARKAFATTAALRRRDRRVVRRRGAIPADELPPTSTSRSSAPQVTALRREPPPARRPLPAQSAPRAGGTTIEQHSGLALSYLNLFDADAAWRWCTTSADEPAAVDRQARQPVRRRRRRHARRRLPAGATTATSRSAFGGIVARQPAGRRGHRRAHGRRRPGRRGHRPRLRGRRDRGAHRPTQEHPHPRRAAARPASGSRSARSAAASSSRTPTRSRRRAPTGGSSPSAQPTEAEWADAELAWRLVGWVKSNAIVLVKDRTAWGIGAGQQNRVESGQLAATKADGRAVGGACASRRLLPVRRRHRGRRRGRRRRDHPAGRGDARRRQHREGRRARRGDGVHRRAPLPALSGVEVRGGLRPAHLSATSCAERVSSLRGWLRPARFCSAWRLRGVASGDLSDGCHVSRAAVRSVPSYADPP